MKLKCKECGRRSVLALCEDHRPENEKMPINFTSFAWVEELPKLKNLVPMVKSFVFAIIEVLKSNFPHAISFAKQYSKLKNWNFNFNKKDIILVCRETFISLIPLLIFSFIASTILINSLPGFVREFLSGSSPLAVTFLILNLFLGVGLVASASASAELFSFSLGGEISNTIRFVISGLTCVMIYFLAKKARNRWQQSTFLMNKQTETLTTGLFLSAFTLLSNLFSSSILSGSKEISDYGIKAGVTTRPEILSLLWSPLVVAIAITVLAYVMEQKSMTNSFFARQIVDFFKLIFIFAFASFILISIINRDFKTFLLFVLFLPTIALAGLAYFTGVPFIGLDNSSYGGNSFFDLQVSSIFHPTIGLIFSIIISFISISILGALSGFRYEPSLYSIRDAAKFAIILSFTISVLALYLSVFSRGNGSALFDQVNTSSGGLIAPNIFILFFAAIFWGAAYKFGGRYLSNILSETSPSLIKKLLPRLKITPSEFYQVRLSESQSNLSSPLQIESRGLYWKRRFSLLKKLAPVALVVFIVTGPLNSFLAEKISSPATTIENFFDSYSLGNGQKVRNLMRFGDFNSGNEVYAEAVESYLAKPILRSYTIALDESNPNEATATVEYEIDGDINTHEIVLVRDPEEKKFGIFPTWKIIAMQLFRVDFNTGKGFQLKVGDTELDSKKGIQYLLPGKFKIVLESPFGMTSKTYTVDLEGVSILNGGKTEISSQGRDRIINLIKSSLDSCNSQNFTPETPECPLVNTSRFQNFTFDSFNDVALREVEVTSTSILFTVDFTGQLQFKDAYFGNVARGTYSTSGREIIGKINASDNFETIAWDENSYLYNG